MKQKLILLFATIAMAQLLSVGCFGQANGGGRLAGTWDAVVQIKSCDTGAVLAPAFASIANFERDGTSLGSTSGRPQSGRTPEHGIWRHVSGNTYRFKFKTFSFDTAGQAIGYSIVEHNVYLNETADSYYSEGGVRHFLLNGTQVGSGCSDAVGTRMVF